VAAVERAVSAAGHVIVDMAAFPAADQAASSLVIEQVKGSDVYIGLLGTRYGSPVRDKPDVSYTELEFDTATVAGLDRLVFLLDTGAADVGIPLSMLIDQEFGTRQQEFRRRVQGSGLVTQTFSDPATLGQLVERSLRELASARGTDRGTGRDDGPRFGPLEAGRLAEQAGDLDEARRWYQQAADSGNVAAQRGLARLAEQAGDLDQARLWYQQAAESGDLTALGGLARLAERIGDLDQARLWYQQAADSGDVAAVGSLARLAEQVGDLDQARLLYQRAADSGDLAAQSSLARLAEQAGDLDQARNSAQQWAQQLFDRLSRSSARAMAYADGLRSALNRDEVHMEHLILGLYQKEEGPTRRLLDHAGVGQAGLMEALDEAAPTSWPSGEVVPGTLRSLPPVSPHVTEALDHAARLAESVGSAFIRSRHLLYGALSVADCDVVKALAGRGIHASGVENWDTPSALAIHPTLLAGATADTVPEPGHGRVRTADRLGIFADVEMLVSVLLASDTPLPLAVGLFGNWGSGKSFFMALMQERIDELAELAAQGRPEAWPFCREVRQVRFNAWHYVDANLWASLAATLFDELARAHAPDETQIKFTELDEARKKAEEARQARQQLEDDVARLAASANRLTTVVWVSAPLAIRAVRDDPQLISKLRSAARDGTTTDSSTVQLVNALGEIDNAAGKTGAAWRLFQEEVLHRRRWATLLTLIVLVGAGAAAAVVASWPAGLKAVALVGALAASLLPALSGALRVLYLAREAREARELPLVKKRDELAQAQAREEDAEREVKQREKELAELRDKGLQLQEFVRERAASSDYRGKLGVISQIRRDFEQLVALIPGGKPGDAEQSAAVIAAVKQHVPEVERIVLFVDDLDRCPHDKVVEVLQAVHLLLAFKLFVVVVGVDSRWLERSLRAHYKNLLEEPASYLEKIFQIPFMLQPMTPDRYRDLVDGLTTLPSQPSEHPDSTPAKPTEQDTSGPSEEADDIRTGLSDSKMAPAPEAVKLVPTEPAPLPRPEALLISNAERELLGQVGAIVPTPRAAKRLVNIYRMLRVSVQDDELEAFLPSGGSEYQALVLLVGILVGRPPRANEVFERLKAVPDTHDIWEVLGESREVYEPLATVRSHIKVTQAGPYRRWAPRVSRFSFRTPTLLALEEEPQVHVQGTG
jgi:TPR repeat protein